MIDKPGNEIDFSKLMKEARSLEDLIQIYERAQSWVNLTIEEGQFKDDLLMAFKKRFLINKEQLVNKEHSDGGL